MSGLLRAYGEALLSREELALISTPEPTATHRGRNEAVRGAGPRNHVQRVQVCAQPIPHVAVVEAIVEVLSFIHIAETANCSR